MTAEMTLQAAENGMAVIHVQLPAKDAGKTAEAIRYLLSFGGQDVRERFRDAHELRDGDLRDRRLRAAAHGAGEALFCGPIRSDAS